MQETIARVPTPPTGSVPSTSDRLPQGMVEDAAKRLGWLALVVADHHPVGSGFPAVRPAGAGRWRSTPRSIGSPRCASELMAIGVFALRRYRVVLPRVLLVIGMVWEVVVSFCISMIETSLPTGSGASDARHLVDRAVDHRRRRVHSESSGVDAASPRSPPRRRGRSPTSSTPLFTTFRRLTSDKLATWPFFNYLFAILAYLIGRRMYGITIAAQTARGARQLSTGGADRRRRHGRGVEGQPSDAGAVRRDQVDSHAGRGKLGEAGRPVVETLPARSQRHRRVCSRRTRSTSTTSAWRAMGASTT